MRYLNHLSVCIVGVTGDDVLDGGANGLFYFGSDCITMGG